MCEKYNGWNNYETWAVSLWQDNEQYSYYAVRDLARDSMREYGPEDSKYELSKILKENMEENNPLNEMEANVYSDLLSAAISSVDFYEIAGHLIDEIKEEFEEEQE